MAEGGRLENGSMLMLLFKSIREPSSDSSLAFIWNLAGTWCLTKPKRGLHSLSIIAGGKGLLSSLQQRIICHIHFQPWWPFYGYYGLRLLKSNVVQMLTNNTL